MKRAAGWRFGGYGSVEMWVLEEKWKEEEKKEEKEEEGGWSNLWDMQSVETEASLLSQWFFLQLGGNQSRQQSTVFNEARVAGGKVEVQYADGLQRPEGEKKQIVRLLLPHCLFTSCYPLSVPSFQGQKLSVVANLKTV